MSKVVFILGAGASKQAGAPLMGNFLDVARNLLVAGKVREREAHFNKVFTTIGELQAVHSKAQLDLENLEAVFTILELGKVIGSVPGKKNVEEIDESIASLRQLIVGTLEATMRFPFDRGQIDAPEPYEDFAELIKEIQGGNRTQSVSVITFNYDMAADVALYRAGLGPDYAIANPSSHHGRPVRLLKLHGSLNWATETVDGGASTIYPLDLQSYFSKYRWDPFSNNQPKRLTIGTQLKEAISLVDPGKICGDEPLIVPPSWNKADYHRALSRVWKQAASDLSEAERIYVAGYSLPETDSFFRHLYALGSVGPFPLRRFGVYDPDTTGYVEGRFRSLLGPGAAQRFTYTTCTFRDALGHIREDLRRDQAE